MGKIMNWKPDTCGCQFQIELNEDESITCLSHFGFCNIHMVGTDQQKFDQAHADNKYKNKCIAQLCKDHEVEASDVVWSFDAEMNLDLKCNSLTKAKITTSIAKVSK